MIQGKGELHVIYQIEREQTKLPNAMMYDKRIMRRNEIIMMS